jgi:hypothetical protein
LKQMQQYYGTRVPLRDRAREGNQKLEWGWCAYCTRMNIEILNCPCPPWKGTREEWRGLEGVSQLGLWYTYAWKHQDTPCVAIFISISKNTMFLFYVFSLQEKQEGWTGWGGWHSVGGKGVGKGVGGWIQCK